MITQLRSTATANHEAAHAVAAYRLGRHIVQVALGRHSPPDSNGQTVWTTPVELQDDLFGEAVILAAGATYEPDSDGRDDDEKIRHLWAAAGSPKGWIGKVKAEAFIMCQRSDFNRAATALAFHLTSNIGILFSLQAEQIIQDAQPPST